MRSLIRPQPVKGGVPFWVQDGFAVVAADGPGEYEVAFEATAGTAPGRLSPGSVAYITTGAPAAHHVEGGHGMCCDRVLNMSVQARPCRMEPMRLSR